ncbi:MAG: toprim domain-containing protein [Thaumarchaeota archaeon]|nr:toprim domain-containing protein [Nitrososphaerota archaeon]
METDNDYTFEYLPLRGISEGTFRFYNVKSKVDGTGKPTAIGFTYPNGSTKVRGFDKKEFSWSGESKPDLFGLDKFAVGADKAIIITEGELDACSLYQVLRIPCVSVRSASSAATDVSAVRSSINSYEKIYLGFDNDAAGEAATAAVARLFDYNKIYHLKYSNRKDANEYLQHNESNELLNLFHNAKHYLPSTIVSSLEDFKKILSEEKRVGISYPFPTLTKMTYGIRTGECVLLKAPEKVGKTALMHAIEYHLLKETDANVGAIFIEEERQRHLQSLAGLELKSPVHLPDCNVPDEDVFGALRKVVSRDNRLFVYNHFGTADPDVILDTVRFLVTACSCRYILFDHISMAVTGIAGEKDERRALEYLASRLEMMVKELDFALIMVSHVNDFGQTRGSHYLTKLADITISARRDTESADELERRRIYLSIPFNRFSYYTGDAGCVLFNPDTYTLTEEGTTSWPISPSLVPDMSDMSTPIPTEPKLGLMTTTS